MFFGLWGPILILLAYFGAGEIWNIRETLVQLIGIEGPLVFLYVVLGVWHRMTSTYAVLGTPILRDEVRKNKKKIPFHPPRNSHRLRALGTSVCIPFRFFLHAINAWTTVGILFTRICDDSLGAVALLRARVRGAFDLSHKSKPVLSSRPKVRPGVYYCADAHRQHGPLFLCRI